MKNRARTFVVWSFCLLALSGCGKPADFTGFWKVNCTDAFGVQIKKQPGEMFSVSFCGPGGCSAPGDWRPNTRILSDPEYRVINATTIEIKDRQGWTRYARCTTETNPVLDYATMPAPNERMGAAAATTEPTTSGEAEKDTHRPACTDATCQKVRAFLKKHYCGDAPFGNGPDDSCDIRDRTKRGSNVRVIADYSCEWNEVKSEAECKQQGQVTLELHSVLSRELQDLGVAANARGKTYFTVWQGEGVGWLLAAAYYSNRVGDSVELCEVVAVVDTDGHVIVLRKLPLTKTDVDVPDVTQWTPLDLADTSGDGHLDVILTGDAYEDHWLEVVRVEDRQAKTTFSGLGYYL